MDIDAVKSSYARWAPIYDRTFGAATRSGRTASVEFMNAEAGPEILEVGVGTGLALPLYAPGKRVTGVDYSDEMLARAAARVEAEGLTHVAGLRQMDARELDFPDASFDAVAAMHMISVVPEPERVMAEMVRVLRPGGVMVVTNHFARETGGLARIERFMAPFANVLGWHSDFDKSVVTGTPGIALRETRALPPVGMMTLLILERTPVAAAAAVG
ncbi:SAM-dependent methyltransferase [Pseudooceanicola nanhaiensis]|uniref:SAM-dependent methyltransferase n=1 Tax=Pseudooceanicola nanhaiensis TaxID=375761 RepID=A0A917WDY2_9RHOB|nr:class I SAM-dependent methyltransferase [Pseudooceanicola nanhaiensis]GGL98337.1 SAM-dependent methyltransferase [Pseudooceanicola nanhaiensis]